MKKLLTLLLMVATVAMVSCKKDEDKTFTVTFDSQGGSEVAAQTVKEGEKATKPTNPTKNALFFGGWYKEITCVNVWNFETDVVTTDLTLYAKWTTTPPAVTQFTVTFQTNGGNSISPQSVDSGSVAVRPNPSPTKSNAAFDNWYKDSTLNTVYNFNTPVTVNLTLYAKWTEGINRDSLQALIGVALNFNNEDYTYSTWENMAIKRDNAQNIADAANSTEQQIIEAYTALKDAIAALRSIAQVKTEFLAAVAALPAPAQITAQHEDAIDAARDLFDEGGFYHSNDPEIQTAFQKLTECAMALENLPDIETHSYSFTGNVMTVYDNEGDAAITMTYTPSGAFPLGTYLSGWDVSMSISCDVGINGHETCDTTILGYGQQKLELLPNGIFTMAFRSSDNRTGSSPSAWEEGAGGTYEITGTQATGGTITMTFEPGQPDTNVPNGIKPRRKGLTKFIRRK